MKTVVKRVHSWRWKRPRRDRPASRAAGTTVLLWRNLAFELTTIPFVGMYVSGLWNESKDTRLGRGPDRRYERPDVKKKTSAVGASTDRHLAALETAIFGQLLPLVEHCAVTRYEDGDPRLTGWIRMGTLGGAWTLDVKDPDAEMSFRLVDSSLDKVWEAAALLLACEEAPFAPDPYLKRKVPAKKK